MGWAGALPVLVPGVVEPGRRHLAQAILPEADPRPHQRLHQRQNLRMPDERIPLILREDGVVVGVLERVDAAPPGLVLGAVGLEEPLVYANLGVVQDPAEVEQPCGRNALGQPPCCPPAPTSQMDRPGRAYRCSRRPPAARRSARRCG